MRRPVPHNGGTGLEEGPEGGGISTAAGVRQTGSAALAVTADQASQATIHLHRRLGMTLAAQLGTGGIFLGAVVTLCIGLTLGSTTGELGALLFQIGPLMLIDLVLDQADMLEVLLQHIADLGHQRRAPATTALHVATLGIEHAAQLLDQEGAVAALAEHRRDDQRQRRDPLVVLHVLRIDEDLERTALFVLTAPVENH